MRQKVFGSVQSFCYLCPSTLVQSAQKLAFSLKWIIINSERVLKVNMIKLDVITKQQKVLTKHFLAPSHQTSYKRGSEGLSLIQCVIL